MKITAEFMVEQFLRTYIKPFTAVEFCRIIKDLGVKSTVEECIEYLETSDYVFALSDSTYITRAMAFSCEKFSFKPTRKEFDKGVFVAGHRCMPFADPDILSCHYNFFYKHKQLPKEVIEYDGPSAGDLFFLYGEEYMTQYICSDPANREIELSATDFELPYKIHLTANSLAPLIKDGFKFGDRLVCQVVDWDTCVIEIGFESHNANLMQMEDSDIMRELWYKNLEKSLVDSFDILGPKKSIEEQLAMVVFDSRDLICVDNCGSIECLFKRSKKIGFEPYGVETRLWHKGKDVPAFGLWNQEMLQEVADSIFTEGEESNFEKAPEYIIDAFLKDSVSNSQSSGQDELKSILTGIYPNFYRFTAQMQKVMLLHLKNRRDIISGKYNLFAEKEFAPLRHSAIKLYSSVIEIVYAIDLIGSDLSKYPQQPLVIFSQIYNHLIQIIRAIELEPQTLPKDLSEVSLSLEGMQCNFEGILGDLKEIIEQQKKKGFVVS